MNLDQRKAQGAESVKVKCCSSHTDNYTSESVRLSITIRENYLRAIEPVDSDTAPSAMCLSLIASFD